MSDLIGNGTWFLDDIRQWITDEECAAISEIPLSSGRAIDVFVWAYNKNGIYSVRSGHHLLAKTVTTEHSGVESSRMVTDVFGIRFGLSRFLQK